MFSYWLFWVAVKNIFIFYGCMYVCIIFTFMHLYVCILVNASMKIFLLFIFFYFFIIYIFFFGIFFFRLVQIFISNKVYWRIYIFVVVVVAYFYLFCMSWDFFLCLIAISHQLSYFAINIFSTEFWTENELGVFEFKQGR